MANGAVLEVKDLRTYFFTRRGTVKAVDGVSFTLNRGACLGVVGESGCGKSVTSLSLLRLVPKPAGKIVGGEIRLLGEDLLAKSEREMRGIRGKRISIILQDPMLSLNPMFTIGNQTGEGMQVHRGLRAGRLADAVEQLLKAVKIPSARERSRSFPHEMSGGMRQRVVGAIAIACSPSVLIADEPTTSLDVTIQAQYLRMLKELQEKNDLSLLFITHDFGIVAQMCDDIAVMYAGRIVERGPVAEVFDHAGHPYTQALLMSVPRFQEVGERLRSIDGEPPALDNLPRGCAFHPRCPRVKDVCRETYPPEREVVPGHFAACWAVA